MPTRPAVPVVLGLLLVAACTLVAGRGAGGGDTVPAGDRPVGAGPAGQVGPVELAALAVDDGRAPGGYRRELFPTWLDTDHDGCDARDQALVAASDPPARVAKGCDVRSGRWFSDYDGRTLRDPSDVDIDHVVPLADAWRSGASSWTTDQRARFANDQANLWPVSAGSNRSKGDDPPDRWRPPRRESWCTYARRWVTVKVSYQLTATTSERDALGQMLDTCAA